MLEFPFWAKAIMIVNYLINKFPLTTLDIKTYEENSSIFFVNLKNMKIFGCVSYVYKRKGKKGSCVVKCMFLK